MNSICPFDLQQVNTDVFLTYLLSIKRSNNNLSFIKRSNNAYFSVSCYGCKCSAFMHLIAQSGQIQYESDKKAMSKMMEGLRKTIAKDKPENSQLVIEGKEDTSFKCHQQTYKLLIDNGSPDSVFSLCFFNNAMESYFKIRSDRNIFFKQVKWENNHQKNYFPKHKSDQIGLIKDEAKHDYSNPNDQSICPLRALASYLLVFPSIFVDENKLFPGKDQKKHFNTCFHRVTNPIHAYMKEHGDPKELGSHSIRKGAATYCCAGVHPTPPIVSVNLRAVWTVGRVKERYIKYENAGDEFVGRTLTGIPPTSCDFGISPVYLKQTTENSKDIDDFSSLVFPIEHSILIN